MSFSNKKKIRGWKNQVSKIKKWKKWYMNLHPEDFKDYDRDFVKILIDPWYRLVKRNPPMWFNRLILDSMIDIYFAWYKALSNLGEPFNLKLWIFEPNFILSQIVYDKGSEYGYYKESFVKDYTDKKFPYEKYMTKNNSLYNFTWELYIEYDYFFEILDELSDKKIESLLRKGYEREVYEDGDYKDIICKKPKNKVWVGKITEKK